MLASVVVVVAMLLSIAQPPSHAAKVMETVVDVAVRRVAMLAVVSGTILSVLSIEVVEVIE